MASFDRFVSEPWMGPRSRTRHWARATRTTGLSLQLPLGTALDEDVLKRKVSTPPPLRAQQLPPHPPSWAVRSPRTGDGVTTAELNALKPRRSSRGAGQPPVWARPLPVDILQAPSAGRQQLPPVAATGVATHQGMLPTPRAHILPPAAQPVSADLFGFQPPVPASGQAPTQKRLLPLGRNRTFSAEKQPAAAATGLPPPPGLPLPPGRIGSLIPVGSPRSGSQPPVQKPAESAAAKKIRRADRVREHRVTPWMTVCMPHATAHPAYCVSSSIWSFDCWSWP